MSSVPAVVVAGTAAVTCCGLGAEALWSEVSGKSTTNWNREKTGHRFSPTEPAAVSRRAIHSDHRLTAFVLAAIEHDLGAVLAELSDEERERMGVALGTAYGHLQAYLDYFENGTEHGYRSVNPRHFPHTLPNCGTVSVSRAYSIWGSNTTIATGLAAGYEAIAYAADAIRRGDEQWMLAGAFDEINACNIRGPTSGEGVGVLLLRGADSAMPKGQGAVVEICATTVTRGLSWSTPDATAQALEVVRETLQASETEVSDTVAVFPSGCADGQSPDIDAGLLEGLFGQRLAGVDVVLVKPVIGECFAAFGPLQCVAAARYLTSLPADPDGESDPAAALVYSAGYDGTFAATLLRRNWA